MEAELESSDNATSAMIFKTLLLKGNLVVMGGENNGNGQ